MGLRSKLTRLVGRDGNAVTDGGASERRRVHAQRDDDFVVFIVGMRVNSFLKVHRWLPVFLVAPRMVRELEGDPESGLLGSWTAVSPPRTFTFVQYWDSFESLQAYARDSDRLHLDAWQEFSQRDSDAVTIWHETYRISADDYETVYVGDRPAGLGRAQGSDLVPATGHLASAAGRLDGVDRLETPPDRAD